MWRRFWKFEGFGGDAPAPHQCLSRLEPLCSRQKLEFPHIMMHQMSLHTMNLWTHQDEDIPFFFRQALRCCEQVHKALQMPCRDHSLVPSWWRYAGQVARSAVCEPCTAGAQRSARCLVPPYCPRVVVGATRPNSSEPRTRHPPPHSVTTGRPYSEDLRHTEGLEPRQQNYQRKQRWIQLKSKIRCTYTRRQAMSRHEAVS